MPYFDLAPFNTLVDDDGTNTVGTIVDKAKLAYVYNGPIDAALTAVHEPPRCSAFNSTTQSLGTSGTIGVLNLDSEEIDTVGMHDVVTNNSRLTVPAALGGWYRINGFVTFAINGTGMRYVDVKKNDAVVLAAVGVGNAGASVETSVHLAWECPLLAGDFVELRAMQTSGGALNVGSTALHVTNRLQLVKV